MRKIVFVDLDGTLLDHNQRMSDSTRDAVSGAVSAGHELVMCTGRGKPEIYPELWDLGFRGLVGCNGSYGEIDGNTVFNIHMPESDTNEVSSWLDNHGVDCFWATGSDLYPTRNFLDLFQPNGGVNAPLNGDWSGFFRQVRPYLRENMPETASKVTFFLPPASGMRLTDIQQKFSDRFSVVAGSLPHSFGDVGELTAMGMNKSVGLHKFVEILGASIDDTIALGDSANDIEMIESAKVGVAMGNATAEVKEVADLETASIDDGGVARAFEMLGLLN